VIDGGGGPHAFIRREIGRVGVVLLVLWELITLPRGSKIITAHILVPSPSNYTSLWLSSRSLYDFAGACCCGSPAAS
jgi:hypothetical protein